MPTVNITNDAPAYSENTSGGSITIPSGSVIRGTIAAYTGNGRVEFDGAVGRGGNFAESGIIFPPNATLNATDGSTDFVITGYDIGNYVDNNTVREYSSGGGSVTVPTGETWDVYLQLFSNNTSVYINGRTVEYNGRVRSHFVLDEGDSFEGQDGYVAYGLKV